MMGGQGATGVGQNEWEHGRKLRAASGCLAHVKHEWGRAGTALVSHCTSPAHVDSPRPHPFAAHPMAQPTPQSITEPPSNVPWACKMSVLLRLVPAAPRPLGWVCGQANVWVTGQTKGHTSGWARGQASTPSWWKCEWTNGWAGEPTERIGERVNEWVGVHCVRSCIACGCVFSHAGGVCTGERVRR